MPIEIESRSPLILPRVVMDYANEKMEETMLPKIRKRHRIISSLEYTGEVNPELLRKPFQDAFAFITLNERNPHGPAEKLRAAADVSGATALTAFVGYWEDEEVGHGEAAGELTVAYGILTQQQLDQETEQMRARYFSIGENYGATESNTYTITQEDFGRGYYIAMFNQAITEIRVAKSAGDPLSPLQETEKQYLIKENPILQLFLRLIPQEGTHMAFAYQYLMAIREGILKHDPKIFPDFRRAVARTLGEFGMPGRIMIPDRYYSRDPKAINFPLKKQISHLARNLHSIIGYEGMGEAALAYLGNNPEQLITDPVSYVAARLHQFNQSWLNIPVGWAGSKYLSAAN